MSDKRYVVPEEAVEYVIRFTPGVSTPSQLMQIRSALEAFAKWIAEDMKGPTDEQLLSMRDAAKSCPQGYDAWVTREWMRRIFLSPEIEYPEELRMELEKQGVVVNDGNLKRAMAFYELGRKADATRI